jgi:predicted Rossmann fold nucleotide-binding protein DprA/Smf involved in DNA uptake
MKIGIVGSRRRTDYDSVIKLVSGLPKDTVVVSGGCDGPDKWAEKAAKDRGLQVIVFLPQWPKPFNPDLTREEVVKVFYDRNRKIAEISEKVYAFVSPDRRGGTENTIKHCEELGVPVEIL